MIHLLRAVSIIPLHQHDLLGDLTSLRYRAEADDGTGTRIGLLVTMRHTHTSTNGNIETSKFAIRVGDSDEADIVREHIDVVVGWDRNGNFELRGGSVSEQTNASVRAYLARKIELSVERLEVLQCISRNELLV